MRTAVAHVREERGEHRRLDHVLMRSERKAMDTVALLRAATMGAASSAKGIVGDTAPAPLADHRPSWWPSRNAQSSRPRPTQTIAAAREYVTPHSLQRNPMAITPPAAPPIDNLTETEAAERARLLGDVEYAIHLELSSDLTHETFEATTEATFTCRDDGVATFIDIKSPAVTSLEINGTQIASSDIDFDGNRVHVRGLSRGRNVIRLSARCNYEHSGIGLHRFCDPGDGRIYMWAHFEPFDAHRMFPCFDQPDLKAHFEITATAPSAWELISNCEIVEERDLGDGRRWVRFGRTEKISTYLAHLSAGDYLVIRDGHGPIPLALFARHTQQRELERDADEIFAITRAGLDWFRDYFGFEYPFGKYDQIFCPEFNMGAMENPGAVTFNDMAYLPAGAVTDAFRCRRAMTILHEMGHVYGFGDLVTMRWWNDLWLNESFADWVATKATAECTRFATAYADFANTRKPWGAGQDQMVTTHAVATQIPDTNSVRLLFDGISYAKGASVLKQLAAWVGDDNFRTGLRDYFQRFRWDNATLADFLGALEKSSGRDLTAWSREWLETPGMNTLKPDPVVAEGRVRELRVRQTVAPLTRTPENPEGRYTLRSHRIGIGFYHLADGTLRRTSEAQIDISGEVTSIADAALIGADDPDLILVNDNDLTFAKLRFDERSLTTLTGHLSAIDDVLSRSLCWAALWDMTRDAELPAHRFVELTASHAPAETEVAVLERLIVQGIAAIDRFAAPDSDHKRTLRRRLADAARQAMDNATPGSGQQLAWFRGAIALATDDADLDWLENLLDDKVTIASLPLDRDLRWLILGRLGSCDRPSIDARIDDELVRDTSDIGRRRALAARAARPTASAKADAWERALDPSTPLASVRTILSGFGNPPVGGFAHEDQRSLLEAYALRFFEVLPTMWRERHMEIASDFTTAAFPHAVVDTATLDRTQALIEDRTLGYPATRLLREAKDSMERAMRARAADRP